MNAPVATLPELEAWALLEGVLPRVLPAGWTVRVTSDDGASYIHTRTMQTVIVSVARELDGRRWLHFSTAFPARLPTWAELRDTARLFIGRERCSVLVIPPESEHVNIHNFVLHTFSCLDGETVPNFTRGGSTL